MSERPIVGAEDIVALSNGDLLVSAHDRRATGAGGFPPPGGVYLLKADALNDRQVELSPLLPRGSGDAPHINEPRPHGIDAIETGLGTHVAFVNREKGKRGANESGTSIVTFRLNDGNVSDVQTHRHPQLCRANDVAFSRPLAANEKALPDLFVTLDRRNCSGFWRAIENVIGEHSGRVAKLSFSPGEQADFEIIAEGFFFANGLAMVGQEAEGKASVAVAETRAQKASIIARSGSIIERAHSIAFPGSPDNLSVTPDGEILAALHSNLFWLSLYRQNLFVGQVGSRVVSHKDGRTQVLFDDPTGEIYSAASVAVRTTEHLVMGSVGEEGLLVCSN